MTSCLTNRLSRTDHPVWTTPGRRFSIAGSVLPEDGHWRSIYLSWWDATRNMGTVSIKIEPVTGLAIATCSGVLRFIDAQKGLEVLWNTPDWFGKSAIWDFRDAKFDLSTSDIRKIARFVLLNQPDIPPLKVAFVTKLDVDFGMARMFEVFREDSRTVFQVFREYNEAIEWARSP